MLKIFNTIQSKWSNILEISKANLRNFQLCYSWYWFCGVDRYTMFDFFGDLLGITTGMGPEIKINKLNCYDISDKNILYVW